jgi:hypothetical protein
MERSANNIHENKKEQNRLFFSLLTNRKKFSTLQGGNGSVHANKKKI